MRKLFTDAGHVFVTVNRRRTHDGPANLPEGSPWKHVTSFPNDGATYTMMGDTDGYHVYKNDKGGTIELNNGPGTTPMPKKFAGDEEADLNEINTRLDRIEQAIVVLAGGEEEEGGQEEEGSLEERTPWGEGEAGGDNPYKKPVDRRRMGTSDAAIQRNKIKAINNRNRSYFKVH